MALECKAAGISAASNRLPDPEKHQSSETGTKTIPVIKALGWLDRFLAVWILLAMIIGILLGNFVQQTGPALQKGKFVGVSVPIGRRAPLELSEVAE